jgi:hypothetical protein
MIGARTPSLIQRALAVLTGLGLEVMAIKQPRAGETSQIDAVLRIGRDKAGADYLVGTRRSVTPQALGVVLARLRDLAKTARQPTLLVTDYLTPQVAVHLRALGQSFVDVAGNVYLEAPGLLVYVMVRKPKRLPPPTNAARASSGYDLKILFAVGNEPMPAGSPGAVTAMTTNVTPSAVHQVLAELETRGDLQPDGGRGR